jgi:hypothetical protein
MVQICEYAKTDVYQLFVEPINNIASITKLVDRLTHYLCDYV